MPLARKNTRGFHRKTYSGQLEKIQLLKRGDDQQQGTVVTYVLYQCRRSLIPKSGETLEGDMNVTHTCTWHIPRVELDRVGINYLNPADRIVQLDGVERDTVWQPESTTGIENKMFRNHLCIQCLMLNPAIRRAGINGFG